MENNQLLQKNMTEGHRRIILGAVIIAGLGNIATILLHLIGKGNVNITWTAIFTEISLLTFLIGGTALLLQIHPMHF
ncbi:MAG: hypothetical protein U9N81_14175 [Bacillota bacterium]|nr:hypothetical protein [Bacillota bacterium]